MKSPSRFVTCVSRPTGRTGKTIGPARSCPILPNEDAVREALAKGNPAPGIYFTPHCADMKQMKDPAIMAKFEKGPVAMLTVYPKGAPMLPKHLVLWFGFSVLVSFVAACVARHTLHPGDAGM